MNASTRAASRICLAFAVGYGVVTALMWTAHQRAARALPEALTHVGSAR